MLIRKELLDLLGFRNDLKSGQWVFYGEPPSAALLATIDSIPEAVEDFINLDISKLSGLSVDHIEKVSKYQDAAVDAVMAAEYAQADITPEEFVRLYFDDPAALEEMRAKRESIKAKFAKPKKGAAAKAS